MCVTAAVVAPSLSLSCASQDGAKRSGREIEDDERAEQTVEEGGREIDTDNERTRGGTKERLLLWLRQLTQRKSSTSERERDSRPSFDTPLFGKEGGFAHYRGKRSNHRTDGRSTLTATITIETSLLPRSPLQSSSCRKKDHASQ